MQCAAFRGVSAIVHSGTACNIAARMSRPWRRPGCHGHGRNRTGLLGREEIERALEAAGYARVDDACVAGEALGAAVDKRNDRGELDLSLAHLRLVRDQAAPGEAQGQ